MNKPTSASGSKHSRLHSGNAESRGFFASKEMHRLLTHLSPVVAAVLVDAAFFLRRSKSIFGEQSPEESAKKLHEIAIKLPTARRVSIEFCPRRSGKGTGR